MSPALSLALLVLAWAWPLALACVLLIGGSTRLGRVLAAWSAAPALAAALLLPLPTELYWPAVLLGMRLGLDATGQLFLLFTALLWLAGGVYALAYLGDKPGRSRFFVYFLLAMAGNLGLILAQDLLAFYVFFALMSFASYGLVVHERTAEALRAGRIYMVLVVVGELLLFVGMVLAVSAAGSTAFDTVRDALVSSPDFELILAMLIAGLGIKAGMLGLHVWLPLAHPVAPTPASAVLSGAMIKAGLLGWLRLLPLGTAELPQWGVVLIAAGFAAAFYGVIVGLGQRNPKTLLAYSSISQMGVMTVGVGLGLAAPATWPALGVAIAFYALHHGLAKGALFLGVGVAGATGTLRGRAVAAAALALPALALAGAPLTGGMLAKLMLKAQAQVAPTPLDVWVKTIMPWSALATSLLMARLLYLLWPRAGAVTHPAGAGLWAPWLSVIAAVGLVPWLVAPPMPALEWGAVLWASLWPLALAALVSVAALLAMRRARRWPGGGLPEVPAGDVVILLERGSRWMSARLDRMLQIVYAGAQVVQEMTALSRERAGGIRRLLGGAEAWFLRWVVAVTQLIVLGIVLALVTAL